MSGRALRRLPVLALARYVGTGSLVTPHHASRATTPIAAGSGSATTMTSGRVGADVDVWLAGMEKVVKEQAKELKKLI